MRYSKREKNENIPKLVCFSYSCTCYCLDNRQEGRGPDPPPWHAKKKKKKLMDASSEFPLVFTIYCSYYTYLSSKLLALIMLFGDAAGERMFGLLPMAHRAFSKLWLLSSHIHTHTPSPLQHYHEMCSTNNRVDLATSAQTDRFAFAIDLIQHLDLSWLSLFKWMKINSKVCLWNCVIYLRGARPARVSIVRSSCSVRMAFCSWLWFMAAF